MCATFQLAKNDAEEFRRVCEEVSRKYGEDALTGSVGKDLYPGSSAIISGGQDKAAIMRWGFPLEKSRRVFNARAESLTQKSMFNNILKNRCAVPATRFYEHDSSKHKWGFELPGTPMFYMAGLWRKERERDGDNPIFTFTIVTTRPSHQMMQYHDRMPVLLPCEALHAWLDGAPPAEVCLPYEDELAVSA